MNNIKSFLVLLFVGIATVSFSQNAPINVNQGSNFKIALAPTVGYISFNQTSFGHNINSAFFGGQIAVYNERSTLKKSYLRPQFSYLYHIKKTSDHDFINNQYISFNPEYFFRFKNKFELGAGINLGITKRGFRMPGNGRESYYEWERIRGFSATGMYNFGRFFSSISANYNRVVNPRTRYFRSSQNKQKNLQLLFRIGIKL